jgi:photosystem II stability/assembly factor-like uncharacterized protein
MRMAALAAVVCAVALAPGCKSDNPPGLEDPRVLRGTIHPVDTDRLARRSAVSVDFVSADRGFLATEGDVLLRTSDGGRTWGAAGARIHHLADVDFVSARHGFAITKRDVLLATRDAGDSWQRVHRFPYAPNGPYGPSLVFVDRENGWVVPAGGPIYRTRDAGRTWTRLLFPCRREDHPAGPTFVDDQNGYVVCGGQLATIMQFKALYATSNGGETWRVRAGTTLFSQRVDHALPVTGHAGGVAFRTTSVGLLLTSRGGIDRTDDGGRTWRRVLSMVDEDTPHDVSWASSSRVFAVLFRAGVLRSDDGGRHWHRVYPEGDGTPAGPIAFFSASEGIGFFGDVSFLGGQGAAFATRDGGRTWERHGDLPPRFQGAQQVFRFGDTVLAADGETLVRSDDGGRSWRHVYSPPGPRFVGYSFVSRELGFMVDDAHRLFRTEDGGSSWKVVREQTRARRGVVFVSESRAFLVDYGPPPPDDGKKHVSPPARLLESGDGGEHWREVDAPRMGRVTGIHRFDEKHWWLFANVRCARRFAVCRGQVWRTADGGDHWDLIRLPTTLDAQTVSFASPEVGYAGSPASGLYRTDDGGVTWSYVYPG